MAFEVFLPLEIPIWTDDVNLEPVVVCWFWLTKDFKLVVPTPKRLIPLRFWQSKSKIGFLPVFMLHLGMTKKLAPQADVGRLMQEIFVEMGEPQNVKWLFAGDANETPSESIILESLQPLGGTYRGIGTSTRWEGNRELDWGITNVHDIPCPTKEMHHFADHVPITFTVPIWDQDLSLQYLAFGPAWKKPFQSQP